MPFVNAYVSKEDAKKYDLDNLWNKYNPWFIQMPELLNSFDVHQHAWCVDKERGYWLFYCGDVLTYDSPSGLPEPTDKEVFILHINGQNIEFILTRGDLDPSESVSTDLYPIQFAWEIVSMNPSSLPTMSKTDLLTILKEALTAYKRGLRNLNDNKKALIRCNF
ncbi:MULTISPECIES: hypothetical protein [unclassified Gilliamella]|uniref:hypothetical protein n=1 Tax=unclassified Gilliamella TaxID=2685620 RepID=UPI001305BCDC|nr:MULTISPECIES: hypothetical protein [unclassified Gilliamella]MWP49616.1 hypothetical protein [Gilliamella sp. Lep-s35]MWP69381.1 hypothetical protein [Gilliamella sp. Lep-s5]MWP78348.1 hypothetical protein [Gilliamella sp. Lep-s21]